MHIICLLQWNQSIVMRLFIYLFLVFFSLAGFSHIRLVRGPLVKKKKKKKVLDNIS